MASIGKGIIDIMKFAIVPKFAVGDYVRLNPDMKKPFYGCNLSVKYKVMSVREKKDKVTGKTYHTYNVWHFENEKCTDKMQAKEKDIVAF